MNQLSDEVLAAKEQINALNKKLSRLQDALVIKDEDNEKLSKSIGVWTNTIDDVTAS